MTAHSGQNYVYINNASGSNQDFLFVENRNNSTNPNDWTYPVIIRANGYASFSNLSMSGNISSSNISGSSISGGTITGTTLHGCSINSSDLQGLNVTINNTLQLGTNVTHPNCTVKVGSHTGQTTTVYVGNYALSFYCGILIGVS